MKEFWNKRYAAEHFVYGKEPNSFFKAVIEEYKLKGSILMPAEGEGRNAVFAAKQGLDVVAFDISEEGKTKALKLAAEENVQIRYEVGDFLKMDFHNESFDAAALIYAHFPPSIRRSYHSKIASLLKPGALLFLEGFSKSNLELKEKNPKVGGPNKEEMLFSTESLLGEFPDFEIYHLEEEEIELNEGDFHIGTGRVIRFIGRKSY